MSSPLASLVTEKRSMRSGDTIEFSTSGDWKSYQSKDQIAIQSGKVTIGNVSKYPLVVDSFETGNFTDSWNIISERGTISHTSVKATDGKQSLGLNPVDNGDRNSDRVRAVSSGLSTTPQQGDTFEFDINFGTSVDDILNVYFGFGGPQGSRCVVEHDPFGEFNLSNLNAGRQSFTNLSYDPNTVYTHTVNWNSNTVDLTITANGSEFLSASVSSSGLSQSPLGVAASAALGEKVSPTAYLDRIEIVDSTTR